LHFYCLFQQDDKRTYSVLNQPIAIKSQTEIGGAVLSRGVIILINPISQYGFLNLKMLTS
ncbi:hypothetical protein Q7298_09235, partial [Glaesserella parasuis]|nr:hypothetical protein [Glaesserella parasuis]